jgi:hypothetical protein
MLWIALASAVYVVIGLGCYFFGFRMVKQLRDAWGSLGKWTSEDNASGRPSLFDRPQSRPLELFFKGLGIFLIIAGVTFFFVMMRLPRG